MVNCKERYENILKIFENPSIDILNVDYGFINTCKNIFNKEDQDNTISPIDLDDICFRLSTKKNKYYTYTYDRTDILNKINNYINNNEDMILFFEKYLYKNNLDENFIMPFTDEDKKKSLNDILSMFDFDIKNNTCNCISIVLYALDISYLKKVIDTIILNIYLVDKYLPEFVFRIYLDKSVFEIIYNDYQDNKNDEFLIKIHKIISADNVEIFIIFCNKLINYEISIERSRMLRFLPLLDNDINCVIFREADGVIPIVDCHNIRIFTFKLNYIMMIYAWAGSFRFETLLININNHDYNYNYKDKIFSEYYLDQKNDKLWNKHYPSFWLNYYNEYNKLYNQFTIIDILAGLFGLKVNFNKTYLLNKINILQKFYTNLKENIIEKEKVIIENNNGNLEQILVDIKGGSDEIFLTLLFESLINTKSYQIFNKNIDSYVLFPNIKDLYYKINLIKIVDENIDYSKEDLFDNLLFNNNINLNFDTQTDENESYQYYKNLNKICLKQEYLLHKKIINIDKEDIINLGYYLCNFPINIFDISQIYGTIQYNPSVSNNIIYYSDKFIDNLIYLIEIIQSNLIKYIILIIIFIIIFIILFS